MATTFSYDKRRDDGNCDFDPNPVNALNRVIEQVPELEIVISSTWRWGETVESFQKILDTRGVIGGRVIGFTPRIMLLTSRGATHSAPRGCEIQDWLERFNETDRPYNHERTMKEEYAWREANPYHYLILDDDSDMMYWQRHHFIKTNGRTGFKDVEKAVKILNIPVSNY